MSPKPKLFALLAGIEAYRPPVSPLSGTVNDANRIKTYLEREKTHFDVQIKTLLNEQAHKAAIVDGFRQHLGQAGPDDVALFFFAGHGAQEEADRSVWVFETDGKLETLVTYDGIVEENGKETYNMLADKELRFLIHELAQRGSHVLMVFDCCHSGGNTRNASTTGKVAGARERRYVAPRLSKGCPVRDWSGFLFADHLKPEDFRGKPLPEVLPEGRHVQLAACSSDQSAYEVDESGIFTKNLVEVLERSDGEVTYYDLRSRLRHFIKNQFNQTPQVYAQGEKAADELFRGFLNRKIEGKPLYGNVVLNPQTGLVMDLGAIHGVSAQARSVRVEKPGGGSFTADIKKIESDHTLLSISDPATAAQITPGDLYRGFVEGFLSAPIGVYVNAAADAGDGLALLEKALAGAGANVNRVNAEHEADYTVHVGNNRYRITQPGDPTRPIVQDAKGFSDKQADLVAIYLRHISQWEFVKDLHNPNSFLFQGPPIDVSLFKVGPGNQLSPVDIANEEIRLAFEKQPDGSWGGNYKMKLTNRHSGNLHVSMLFLTLNFMVYPNMFKGMVVELAPGEEAWIFEGENLELGMAPQTTAFNWPEEVSYLKIIANTRDFDVTLLEQDALPAPTDDTRGERSFKLRPAKDPDANDWTTRLLTLRVPNPMYRPADGV